MLMRYTYLAAWSVIGGVFLPPEGDAVELYRSERYRFALTNDPDSLLATADKLTALGRIMLAEMFRPRSAEARMELEAQIEEIKGERKQKAASQSVLVVEAHGDVDATIREPKSERAGFIVTIDAFDRAAVKRAHRAEIDAMRTAFAFESEAPSRFTALAEAVYLTDAEGKNIHSQSGSIFGDFSTSVGLTPEKANRISARFGMLERTGNMNSVNRLFSQAADFEIDRFKAFIFGWTALEIFIAKSFKTYEEIFLSPFAKAGQPTLRERFLQRIKEVMGDKYKLTDKFLAVAAVLFPDAPDIEIQEDFKRFCQIKELRDSIFHAGKEFSERDLPISEVAALLRKYMVAHVQAANLAIKKA